MSTPYTKEELDYLVKNYQKEGPKRIAEKLGRPMSAISKKARRMGLLRGVKTSNTERRNRWEFKQWSYDLGYLAGVYLGDGNVWRSSSTAYFRLTSIDKDFVEAVRDKIEKQTGYKASVRFSNSKNIWIMTFSNTDFSQWLVEEFGKAGEKTIKVLPIIEANRGLLEGIVDSEGTSNRYTITIRMCTTLNAIDTICNIIGINHGRNFKGIREENWHKPDKYGNKMHGYTIPISEYSRTGLGTYIQRKAKNGIKLKKSICYK